MCSPKRRKLDDSGVGAGAALHSLHTAVEEVSCAELVQAAEQWPGAGAGQLGGVATPSHQLPVTVTVSIEQPTAWAEAEEGEESLELHTKVPEDYAVIVKVRVIFAKVRLKLYDPVFSSGSSLESAGRR